MFKPNYKITDKIANHLTAIAAAREIILNASLIPKWEISLRRNALLKSTHASTSIEGNRLSFEEVSDLMMGRDVTALYKDKQEVLNYFKALEYLDNLTIDKKKKLANSNILNLQKIITKNVLEDPVNCGKYRSGKQYVIVGNRSTGKVTFRPPATKDVPKLMNELLRWINNPAADNINSVIEAGVVHYEFVRIHPFIDGNGRTARALATLILIRRGFDTKRFFALDDFYNTDRPRYYQTLQNVNQKTLDLTEWLEYFCEGVNVSLKAVKDKVITLIGKSEQVVLDNKQMKIVEFMRDNDGKATNRQIQDLFKVSNKTAYQLLRGLFEKKVIKQRGRGRNVYYVIS